MIPDSLAQQISEKNIPLSASFELTYQCNHKCIHCYQPSPHQAEDELTTVQIKYILQQLADARCLFLALTGGEPLLHKDFWEIAEYAFRKNFAVTLQTNGSLLTRSSIGRIKELNFFQVHISLLGADSKTHDAITGYPGSFEKVIKATQALLEKKVTVFLKVTLIRENVNQLRQIDKLVKNLGALVVFSPTVFPCIDYTKGPIQHRISDTDLKKAFTYLAKKDKNSLLLAQVPDDESPLCLAGRTDCCISPKGKLHPCVGLPIVLGDLTKETFEHIWQNSDNIRKLRSVKIKDLKKCQDCELASLCVRCPGVGFLENGSLITPSEDICRITKIKKEVFDEYEEKKVPETAVYS